jgi:hypothetical protein
VGGKNRRQGRPLGKTEAHDHSPDAVPDLEFGGIEWEWHEYQLGHNTDFGN